MLLIDDDEWIRDSLRLFFEAEECDLLALETAEEGIAASEDQAFDLMIVDYKLPGIDGLDFLERIRHSQPDAIKILITAYRDQKVVAAAKEGKVHLILEKPLTSETILASLARLVGMGAHAAH